MIIKNSGYTLIEMMVAISLMVIVLMGGTTLFIQNLRTGGMTEADLNLNGSLRAILDEFERNLRYGKVIKVDEVNRDQCLAYGDTGYTGTKVSVEDLNGLVTVYSLLSNKIASTSSLTNDTDYINNDTVRVNSVSIKWFCRSGISDKINLSIDASTTSLGNGVTITRSVSRDLILLNGSTN